MQGRLKATGGFHPTPPEHFLCNVSLPARRAPEALIYDVRALRLEIDRQRVEPPSAALPIRCLTA
jgi:hypothetical protein